MFVSITCPPPFVFKRIANHTRSGGPAKLCLERYMEALQDSSSGLTLPVLTGVRKQSVTDAERLFSPDLAAFMQSKGYEFEARYITVIWNWRRACDERGLSELKRCRFNYEFLNLVLDELMPWHKESYDFRYLKSTGTYFFMDVCLCLLKICLNHSGLSTTS